MYIRRLVSASLGAIGIFVVSFSVAHASIIISEIMYDAPGTDSGFEWIEVYNPTDTAIDIANWRFRENDVNHKLSLEQGVNSVVMPGAYAVIASDTTKFSQAFPSFSGTLFDSVFSLNNQGELLELVADDVIHDSVFYTSQDGANGTGNTLQYTNGSWSSMLASPGGPPVASGTSGTTPPTSSSSDSSPVTTVTSTSKSPASDRFKPYHTAEIILPEYIIAGVAAPFDLVLRHHRKENATLIEHGGIFVWSMGDGTQYEQEWEEPFEHMYRYPGTYIIHVEFYRSILAEEPSVVLEATVIVREAHIMITALSQEGTIKVDSQVDIPFDLSGWQITYQDQLFQFPDHTYIPPQESLHISKTLHDLSVVPGDIPLLIFPSGSEHSRLEIHHEEIMLEEAHDENLVVAEEQMQPPTMTETEIIHNEKGIPNSFEIPLVLWLLLAASITASFSTLGALWYYSRMSSDARESVSSEASSETDVVASTTSSAS